MCRNAYYHNSHWVCLDCQLAVKREDRWQNVTRNDVAAPVFACGNCAKPLERVGIDYKAPKRRDHKAWALLRALIAHGHRHHSGCCDGPGSYPQNLRDLPDFLRQKRRPSEGELLAERFQRRARH